MTNPVKAMPLGGLCSVKTPVGSHGHSTKWTPKFPQGKFQSTEKQSREVAWTTLDT